MHAIVSLIEIPAAFVRRPMANVSSLPLTPTSTAIAMRERGIADYTLFFEWDWDWNWD